MLTRLFTGKNRPLQLEKQYACRRKVHRAEIRTDNTAFAFCRFSRCRLRNAGIGSPGAVVAPSSPWPAAATGSSAHAGGSGFATGLSGQWFHDGKPTSINVDPDGRNLTIIDENGHRSSGIANSPYELEVPSRDSKALLVMEDGAFPGTMANVDSGTTQGRI